MNKKGLTIRFEEEEMKCILEMAAQYKCSSAQIIRWAITALIEYVDKHDGHLHLPINFSQEWKLAKNQHTSPRGKAAS